MSDYDEMDDNEGNRIAGGQTRSAVEYLVKNIVRDPEAVVVDAKERGDRVTLSVHVGPGDKGLVIGRRGRTANALRTVARSVGAREGVNANVDIPDEDD